MAIGILFLFIYFIFRTFLAATGRCGASVAPDAVSLSRSKVAAIIIIWDFVAATARVFTDRLRKTLRPNFQLSNLVG